MLTVFYITSTQISLFFLTAVPNINIKENVFLDLLQVCGFFIPGPVAGSARSVINSIAAGCPLQSCVKSCHAKLSAQPSRSMSTR